jgi:secondary thiamine-phosphate synthase enzyme
MLRQAFHELTIPTRGRGLCEFTREVEKWVDQNQFQDGLLTMHLQHTSASLLIQENADPDVRRDLEAFFKRLVPDGDPLFVHTPKATTTCPRTFAPR